MNFKPLTLRQAHSLEKEYQSLIGQNFDKKGLAGKIECVVVAPYDEINKWIFSQYYEELKCPEQSMAYYTGHFYDVIVMAWSEVENRYVYKDLKVYLKECRMLPEEFCDDEFIT